MADNPTVVELRVHGVSGTSPEALLNCSAEFLEQKAGDKSAGFYRRPEWIDDAAHPPPPGHWRGVTEAYSWGGLTSGRASRALWLLFLPFILVDLAHWMLPPASRRLPAAVAVGLLRLIALSFTLTLMLAAAVAAMDVTVWQCAGLEYCSARWAPLAFLASLDRGVQVAVSAVPLVLMIALLWRLGSEEPVVTRGDEPARDTKREGSEKKPHPPSPAVTEGEVPLEVGSFWNPDDSVRRMRACHVTAWAAGLAAITVAPPLRYAVTPLTRGVSIGLLVADGVVLAVAVCATASNMATARGGTGVNRLTGPLMALRWLSLGLLAASLIWVIAADATYPPAPTHLPGLRGAIYAVLGAQVVLLAALFLFTAVSMRGTEAARKTEGAPGYRMTLGGFTAPLVALLGWLIAGGFSVGVGLWTAQVLGKAVVSTSAASCDTCLRTRILGSPTESFDARVRAVASDAPLIVPPPYVWAAVATVLLIVVAAMAGVYMWLWVIPRRTARERGGVLADYPGANTDDKAVAAQVDRIARARALASLTDIGARLVAGLALVAVAVIIGMAVLYLLVGRFDSVVDWSPVLTNISVAITVSLAVGLVGLAVAAFRNRQLRRMVAILWDVATFWPRANHPLTPPSYGVRTVWDLRLRLAALSTDTETGRVILVAHSQGTVIAAATLLQAKMDNEKYPLLTFGSPLRRLYGQNFPAYFGVEAMNRLRDRQRRPDPRWINLWALSDPIGAWVFDTSPVCTAAEGGTSDMAEALNTVDCRLLDVAPGRYGPDPAGPVCAHSGFWTRDEYDAAVLALQSTVLPEGSARPDTDATVRPIDRRV
ncbi:hypothetical protein [Mycobacterium sp. URHB0021]